DMPARLGDVLTITALVQCLVHSISAEIDNGTFQSQYHPMMVQQNKWRASRFGAKARLVNTDDYEQYSVTETVDRLVPLLRPAAEELDCVDELESVVRLSRNTGAMQQLKIYEDTQDMRAIVAKMVANNPWR
ncbi:MAG: glutamate--cysteine ligase, partial [Planctomycetaceae bacterium]